MLRSRLASAPTWVREHFFLLLGVLALSGCPQAPAATPPLPSASAPTEGEPGYVPAQEKVAEVWKPGEPFPLPQPLPPEARGRALELPSARKGEGSVEFYLGGRGEKDGRFNYPRAMVTTVEGTLFVADKTGRIQKFTPEGKLLAVVRTPGIVQGKPTGLGIDARGDLIVADTHYCRVLVYDQDLQLKRWYGAPGRAAGRFMMITSVHAGEGGVHYTTDFGDDVARVQVFREDGTHLRSFGTFGWNSDQFRRPMNLAVDDARDRLYIADAANHRVCVYTREGKLVKHFGGEGKEAGKLGYPYDVKLDEAGRVWVAEFGNQRLSVFSSEGACLATWGGPGRKLGGLNRPWAVALGPGERVWALDSKLDRCYALTRDTVLGGSH
jgi:DNA-binding beta-propeller fold protein YncE